LEFICIFCEVSFGFNLFGLVVDLVELFNKVLLCHRRQLHARKLCIDDWDCVSQLQQDLDSPDLLCLTCIFGFVFHTESVKKFGALDVAGCPQIGGDRLALDQAHQLVGFGFSSGMSFQSLFGFQCYSKEPNVFHKDFDVVGELLSQVLEASVCD
jgi:hypothetical protein